MVEHTVMGEGNVKETPSWSQVIGKMEQKTARMVWVRRLIARECPPAELLQDLKRFGWDSAEPLATLTRADVLRILSGFLAENLSAKDVEEWADALEAREDVAEEPGYDELLKELIFELANPLLTEPITHDRAKRWIDRLEKATVPTRDG
jgi:hypothetical protein